jgi:hypothetical protein
VSIAVFINSSHGRALEREMEFMARLLDTSLL